MIAFLVGWALMILMCLAICSDSKRREQDQCRAAHPSNHRSEFTDVTIATIPCEFCRQKVYEVATTGDDLLAVLWREWEQFDYAVEWHRQFECGRVPA